MTHELIEVPDDYTDAEIQVTTEIAACLGVLDPVARTRIAGWVCRHYSPHPGRHGACVPCCQPWPDQP